MSDIRLCPKCRAKAYIHNMFISKYRCTACGYLETDREKAKEIELIRIKNGGMVVVFPEKEG